MRPHLALLALLVPLAARAEAPLPRTIDVSGDAEVRVVPDQAFITTAVRTEGKDPKAALKENDERTRAVLELARTRFQIAPQHLQTGQIAIQPVYAEPYAQKPKLVGYSVTRQVVVCLLELARFEELLTALVEAGANEVPGFELQSSEIVARREEARIRAARRTREKAAAIARELGQELGRPITIRESSGYGENVKSYQPIASHGGAMSAFSPGEIVISAGVAATFELVDRRAP